MNKNTAAGLRAACVQVLGVLDDPDQADVASMDIESLLTRFQNLRKQRFKPQVLEAYKRRFRNAVKSYKDYLENPGAWKPANQDRSGGPDRHPRVPNASASGEPRHPRRTARIPPYYFWQPNSMLFQIELYANRYKQMTCLLNYRLVEFMDIGYIEFFEPRRTQQWRQKERR